MPDLPDVIVVLDLGACDWRIGWADEDGPSNIHPAHTSTDGSADESRLAEALHSLESFEELDECGLVLTEPPNESAAHRERVAESAFAVAAVQSLCCFPAPLAAIYNNGFDTGVLVDVGYSATLIYMLFEGRPVLEGATLHPLGGRHLCEPGVRSSADDACDGLFEPALLPSEHAAARALCGVHEAIARSLL